MPGPTIASRPGSSLADLELAGRLSTEAWLAGSPHVEACAGDVDWWFASAWPAGLDELLRIWSADGRPVGWSWHHHDEMDFHVWSGEAAVDEAVRDAIVDAAVAGAEATTGRDGTTLDVWAAEDNGPATARLLSRGFRPTERRLSQFQLRIGLDPVAAPPAPAGYRVRRVSLPDEIRARVDVHRAAFAPSRLSVEKYERLRALPHYRLAHDWVVEARDGTFVAFVVAWWDPEARVGELEPVGTHPDHRRRGLGRALLAHAIANLEARGARLVQVHADAANAAAEALYPSVGFRRRTFHRGFRRTLEPTIRP
ncbi:MAG TPA: GNAT family N-acetyltransferase [Candidatus Limnocylindrales bacterium]|nr:GNAT family N-acetyltransferase [Candidatus Limnocylindrales bacterium]